MGFARKEGTFTPLENGTYTMFVTEASIRHSSTGKIGVNLRLKINDLDENGNPQKNAGRTIFNSYWMEPGNDGLISAFCRFMDALGFTVNENGDYVDLDGNEVPDLLIQENGQYKWVKDTPLPFLVGIPFIGKTTHSINKYENKQTGETKENDQYRVGFIYQNRVTQTSCHPRKTDVYSAPAPTPEAPTGETSENVFGKGW